MKIKLGDRVQDKITGQKGIAVGITEWLYGCRRITIQPEQTKEGKPADLFCIDDPQAKLVKESVLVPTRPASDFDAATRPARHGPRQDAVRGHETPRRACNE